MAAALLQCDAEVVYGHAGGSATGLGEGCEGAIETIAHLDDKKRCGRPHAGRQSGLNSGAALGA